MQLNFYAGNLHTYTFNASHLRAERQPLRTASIAEILKSLLTAPARTGSHPRAIVLSINDEIVWARHPAPWTTSRPTVSASCSLE
jgi:hypothetical protein